MDYSIHSILIIILIFFAITAGGMAGSFILIGLFNIIFAKIIRDHATVKEIWADTFDMVFKGPLRLLGVLIAIIMLPFIFFASLFKRNQEANSEVDVLEDEKVEKTAKLIATRISEIANKYHLKHDINFDDYAFVLFNDNDDCAEIVYLPEADKPYLVHQISPASMFREDYQEYVASLEEAEKILYDIFKLPTLSG
ncbi:hypothetical protein [Scopulibacillus cellulosilyticus]|uniref:Uncharacterized protein n=1 Tax=Scopulibacillus cellulosilyticus TaxID=2665665 RepID=A0ABW2PVI6_9BACL